MIQPEYIPKDYNGIKAVNNLSALFNEQFSPDAHVILLPRKLSGDFNAVANFLNVKYGLSSSQFKKILPAHLPELFASLTGAAKVAADQIQDDIVQLENAGVLYTELRVINPSASGYEEVQKFHADNVNQDWGRMLCCYAGPATEGLRREDVKQTTTSRNGREYYPMPQAQPFAFKTGDIWRHAGENNFANAPPFIHRAPVSDQIRLVLTGDKNQRQVTRRHG